MVTVHFSTLVGIKPVLMSVIIRIAQVVILTLFLMAATCGHSMTNFAMTTIFRNWSSGFFQVRHAVYSPTVMIYWVAHKNDPNLLIFFIAILRIISGE